MPGTANKVFALELGQVSYKDARILEPSDRPESINRALQRIEQSMFTRSRRSYGFEKLDWNSKSSKFGKGNK